MILSIHSIAENFTKNKADKYELFYSWHGFMILIFVITANEKAEFFHAL